MSFLIKQFALFFLIFSLSPALKSIPFYLRWNRTTTRRTRSHYPDDSPSFYRRDFQGGLNRAPVSGHSMEFLRGIYAFMQVSRSSVSVRKNFPSSSSSLILSILFHVFLFIYLFIWVSILSDQCHQFAISGSASFFLCLNSVCASYDEISYIWKLS